MGKIENACKAWLRDNKKSLFKYGDEPVKDRVSKKQTAIIVIKKRKQNND